MTQRQARMRAAWFVALVGVALAIPRVARIAYPQIWIEDEWYLNGAFLLSRGLMPYRDFPLPHLPLLEVLMAAVFAMAPIAVRTAEIVTAIAAFAGSMFVFAIGRRLGGRVAGTVAALVYATSGLLFRYHVYEREVFDVVPVLVAFWLSASGQEPEQRSGPDVPRETDERRVTGRGLVVGALLAAAMAVKLTAVAAFAAILADLFMARRTRQAWTVGATAIGILAVGTIALAATFGSDFIIQVFVFRIVHASFPSLGVKLNEMRYTLDIAFGGGIAGIVFVVWTRQTRWRPVLLQLISGFVLLVLLNATYWAHTGIELLPWLALSTGALAAGLANSMRRAPERSGRTPTKARRSHQEPLPAWVCAGGAVLLVLFVSPIKNLNWQGGGDEGVDGFGYRDRSEIARIATFVRAHTGPGDLVATPPIIAFAANRREIVPYAELWGDINELSEAVRRDGYLTAIATSPLRERGFWGGVDASKERMTPLIDDAVSHRTLGAVVDYSEDDLFPVAMVDVSQDHLEAARYELGLITSHYEAWTLRR